MFKALLILDKSNKNRTTQHQMAALNVPGCGGTQNVKIRYVVVNKTFRAALEGGGSPIFTLFT